MKMLIVSDTHGKNGNLLFVMEKEAPFDLLIHLGDGEGCDAEIEGAAHALNLACQVVMVRGNNDFYSQLDNETEITVGTHHMLLTHGHYYYVSVGESRLREEALARGCDIAMYGHTHRPFLEVGEKLTILNPGSLSYPRQQGRVPSYMIAEMDEDGTMHYELKYLSE